LLNLPSFHHSSVFPDYSLTSLAFGQDFKFESLGFEESLAEKSPVPWFPI
jgi:hypothetical protein